MTTIALLKDTNTRFHGKAHGWKRLEKYTCF